MHRNFPFGANVLRSLFARGVVVIEASNEEIKQAVLFFDVLGVELTYFIAAEAMEQRN